jgi:hypothetical protein
MEKLSQWQCNLPPGGNPVRRGGGASDEGGEGSDEADSRWRGKQGIA